MRVASRIGLVAGLVLAAAAPVLAGGFVTNGDFEAGNTGFTSVATYKASGGLGLNQYTVRSNPTTANGGWCGVDHTSGSGLMLLVDSALGAAWQQTVNLAPGSYVFSAWVMNVLCPGTNIDDPVLQLRVDGTVIAGSLTLPESNSTWISMSGNFTVAVAGPVTLTVWSLNNAGNGADFAVDDVCLQGTIGVEAATWEQVKGLYR